MLEDLSTFDVYIGLAINGVFTGLGSALGSYIATKHILERMEKLSKRIRRKKKK
jgi:hypothetical protein